MLKRSLLFAGLAGASLLAAAETAPNAGNAPNADAPVVTEEETITIVAVPCSVCTEQPCPHGHGKCDAEAHKKCADKKKCAEAHKKCADKKKCAEAHKKCADKKACAPAPVPDYSDSDYELAYTLMECGGVPAGIDDANAFIIFEQMEQSPMLKPAQPAFEKFFRDHCSYQAMKRDLARLHLATFTRDEMRKLIDFFKTPAGKKLAASQADLTRHTLALRADRIHRNLPELQKNVHECMVKAQQDKTGSTAAAAQSE